MKKLLSVLLAAVLLLGMSSALAEEVSVHLFGLKIEIDPQLKEYANWYNEQNPGVKVTTEAIGGGGDYGSVLKTKNQAGELPQIIQVEGQAGYDDWKEYALDLSDAKFVAKTPLAFKDAEGKVKGFPVAIEGYGLAYNKDILDKAGVDPATLNTRANLLAAFELIESKKAELGLDAVVAGATSVAGGMWWSYGQHVFNAYFSAGLAPGDRTYIDMALSEGKVDDARLMAFAEYMAMLIKYAEPNVLSTGNYDAQVGLFANQKTAFITQGNWIEGSFDALGASFPVGYIGHPFLDSEDNGIYAGPPSWYLVTNAGTEAQQKAAIDFLDSLIETKEGREYMVVKAKMIPAFSGVEFEPTAPLSAAIKAKYDAGEYHDWFFGSFPSGFGMNHIGPILDLHAQDPQNVNVNQLFEDLKAEIAKMPGLLAK